MPSIDVIQLACGATLLVEPNDAMQSAALTWLLPVGSAGDPDGQVGDSTLLSELIFRGAGGLSSRDHSDAFDRLGVHRSSNTSAHHLSLSATMLGTKLPEALPLLAAMVRTPALPADHLDAVKSLALQQLDGLEDDPQHLVSLRLREQHLPAPFNRNGYGERADLENATIEQLREAWATRANPLGSIIGVAGAVDPKQVADQLNTLLDDWSGETPEPTPATHETPPPLHVDTASAQVHIGLAWPALEARSPLSMTERLGISVLSGGTSARLFTEVRQKRSLCYSVGASYIAGRDRGHVRLYAGTTPERAQETLDVSMTEIERLRQGAAEDEFRRAVTGLKSSLIMQGESTRARAGGIASDWFRLGRARTLDDVAAEINAVALDDLNDHLGRRDTGPFTLAVVGPNPLTLSDHAATTH